MLDDCFFSITTHSLDMVLFSHIWNIEKTKTYEDLQNDVGKAYLRQFSLNPTLELEFALGTLHIQLFSDKMIKY